MPGSDLGVVDEHDLAVLDEEGLKDDTDYHGAFRGAIFRARFMKIVDYVKSGTRLTDGLTFAQILNAAPPVSAAATAALESVSVARQPNSP